MYTNVKAPFVMILIVITWLVTACSPQSASPTGQDVPHLDALNRAASSGITADIVKLFQYTSIPCTNADGLGGPPKCLTGEAEGTLVEALPVIATEGHHIRRTDLSSWPGLGKATLYAAYKTADSTFSDEFFPKGDHAIAFLMPDQANVVVFQVTEAGIVRMEYHTIPAMEEILKASEVIFRPTPTPA